ncbi:hypothetical protein BGX26_000984 [Mortierella sp. AD094]|nr:hypothetical protein BGX26_000984 [Mortierella sp. AD094]
MFPMDNVKFFDGIKASERRDALEELGAENLDLSKFLKALVRPRSGSKNDREALTRYSLYKVRTIVKQNGCLSLKDIDLITHTVGFDRWSPGAGTNFDSTQSCGTIGKGVLGLMINFVDQRANRVHIHSKENIYWIRDYC